jgi:hypothetical protein
MKQVRVNIRSVCNVSRARTESRNGREVMIVPSATLPDDVVMNGIKYPADEIGKSYTTLNRTPAPLGHPTVNGQFVSASDPEGINIGYIGAWNENPRRENGRVLLDKVIDIEVANRTDGGKRVLAAINAGDPVHTSTGLLCELEPARDGDGFTSIARNIYFDHDAILLDEEGAATPEQGVGMLVNGKQIEVVNSAIEWADRDLDWAVTSVVDALERREKAGLVDRIKAALIEAFTPLREPNPTSNEKENAMDKEQFEALSAKVNAVVEAQEKIGETIANAVAQALKPVLDAQAEMTANAKAKDEAELAGHIAAIVKANLLDEESAKELTLNAARKLAEKAKPGTAAGINGAPLIGNAADEWADYDLNAQMEAK